MKKILVSLSWLLAFGFAHAQENWCGTDRIIKQQMEANPEFAQQMHESIMRAKSTSSDRVAPYEIPVVFHVIHDNGVGNITKAQIDDALRILNEDYNRTNADASNTRNTVNAPFAPEAGDGQITFKLAKRDPNGNCTNGILRVNAPGLTYNAGESCKSTGNGGSSAWPKTKYMNIWVVNSIATDGQGTTLGYAYIPDSGGSGYGILIRHDACGTIGTANYDGRTLTHEMGHSLGLRHTFNNGGGSWWEPLDSGCHDQDCNSYGDYCCDTPPAPEATWSCNQSLNDCNEVPINDSYGFDAYTQIENYMSYNSCQNMFSKDQIDIVHGYLDGASPILQQLVSNANIINSGINEADQICKADFILSDYSACAGSEIELIDESYHAPTSWTWTVSGTESTDWEYIESTNSGSQNPKVRFDTPGTYSITLLVSDGVNSETEVKSAVLTILPNPGASMPYSEGFEDYANINASPFFVSNNDNDATWSITSVASSGGSKSVKIQNFGSGSDELDELISEPIDMSTVDPDTNVTFSFKYAYNKRSSSNDEWLRFYISKDCGRTWALRKNIHGSSLSPDVSTSSYTPSNSSEWNEVEITNINGFFYTPDFRYKFRFENDNGNNIYIDDINLVVGDFVAGTEELVSFGKLSLYPNPSSSQVNIDLDLLNSDKIDITLTDVSGRMIKTIYSGNLDQGSHQFNLVKGNLTNGTYLVQIKNGSSNIIKRVVFN